MPINATDQDKSEYNRDIRYFLVGEGADLFQMDDVRADITIKHPGTIDCETKCAFHFKVIASDQRGNGLQTKADVYIKVRDQNDNAPEFEKDFLFTLRGDTPPGTTFGQIKAIDRDITKPNNQMLYILKEGGFGKFTVDHDTGDITLVDPLEREPFKNEYKLHVQAIDGGQPRRGSYTDVIINVPINYPPFINQNTTFFPIMENLPAGSDVGKVEAFDPNAADDPTVKLKLSVKGDNVPFDIDNSSGMLRTNISLDRESQEFHFVSVVVTDNGHPPKSSSSTVTVMVLDDNDHAPTFMSDVYKGKVFEDDQRPIYGQLVIMPLNVSANDEDATQVNRDIRYSLEGKHNEMFAINAITGEIRVSQKGIGKIDRETMGEYHLKLVATDQGGKGISSAVDFIVRVEDLNDQSPTFRAKHSSMVVGQKVLAGQEIGDIQADDPDATAPNNEILYMLESDAYGKFKVDMKTGKVVVLQGIFFQPRQQSYILNVAAMDLGYPPRKTYGTVTVKVLKTDFNDFNPEIKGKTMFYTNEEVPIGTFIGKLNAVDADIGPGEKVALSIRADSPVPFKINSETGAIYTTGRLDRDGGNLAYTFEVVAKDQGDPPREARTQVGVILRDINDNPPTFTRHQYRHRVADTFPAGTVVATPFAYDDIDTQNSVYHYSMMGQKPGYFYIDSNSGVVLSTTRLKELGEQILKYKVIATDAYNNNLTAEAELLIDVSGRPKDRPTGKPCCCLIPCTNQTEKAEITNKINTIVNTLQHDSQDGKQNKKNMSAVSGTHNESGVSDEKDTDETSGDSP